MNHCTAVITRPKVTAPGMAAPGSRVARGRERQTKNQLPASTTMLAATEPAATAIPWASRSRDSTTAATMRSERSAVTRAATRMVNLAERASIPEAPALQAASTRVRLRPALRHRNSPMSRSPTSFREEVLVAASTWDAIPPATPVLVIAEWRVALSRNRLRPEMSTDGQRSHEEEQPEGDGAPEHGAERVPIPLEEVHRHPDRRVGVRRGAPPTASPGACDLLGAGGRLRAIDPWLAVRRFTHRLLLSSGDEDDRRLGGPRRPLVASTWRSARSVGPVGRSRTKRTS